MTGILWNLLFFIIALGILVTVHEFGHFWVAKRCGIRVEKFSIGFGKSLWSHTGRDGTIYTVALIPLGGYVKMLDSRVDDVALQDRPFAFDQQSLWKRASVVAAGPVFNFLLAILVYWLVFIIGVPSVKPVIGQVAPNSIISRAGITSGMELKAVSGIKTPDWESVNMQLISHIGDDSMTLTLAPADYFGTPETKTVDLHNWHFDPENESAMQSLGLIPYTPKVSTTIEMVSKDGAAQKAGLRKGDKLLAINGTKLTDWQQVVDMVRNNPQRALQIKVERDGEPLVLTLTPDIHQQGNTTIGYAGIAPHVAKWPDSYRFDMQYGPVESVAKAVTKTGQVIELTIGMLKKLIVGDVGLNNLSGPISIAKGAGATADYGFVYFLGFLALISVNLGIINLVPLPMLDGGHLLFFIIEAVTRRPVPEKIQEMGYRIGGVIIFSLMALALFNDFTRL